ncbi:hypothetical protein [Streptomyces bullii]|uniref:Uncharacterized protein n=1 Tax=Streptomyces bullii TaxID=349910 RepID=A0ABW0V1A1_9ACTN
MAALAGQDIHLIGRDGGGEAVPVGHLFADPDFAIVGADVPKRPLSGGCSRPPPPRHARRHWRGSSM